MLVSSGGGPPCTSKPGDCRCTKCRRPSGWGTCCGRVRSCRGSCCGGGTSGSSGGRSGSSELGHSAPCVLAKLRHSDLCTMRSSPWVRLCCRICPVLLLCPWGWCNRPPSFRSSHLSCRTPPSCRNFPFVRTSPLSYPIPEGCGRCGCPCWGSRCPGGFWLLGLSQ